MPFAVAKHLIEDPLAEGVQAVEGAAAEAAQRVRLIQDCRNSLLLLQRRERDLYSGEIPSNDLGL